MQLNLSFGNGAKYLQMKMEKRGEERLQKMERTANN